MSRKPQILLGVTGGIAAYKAPELVRLLKKAGMEVRVVLSKGAKAFVTPLALQTVSGAPVLSELFDATSGAAMDHIELARWADFILIAPSSANRIAALRFGLADDLLTTLCLATTAPLIVAPAMNLQMWTNPATEENIAVLKNRGVHFLGPAFGEQACGEVGLGRMLQPEEIVLALQTRIRAQLDLPFKGVNILITAGPTQEPIDPVRFLSNRSSGKMGFSVAKAAQQMGANVTLISGPVHLETPSGVTRVNVETADEMLQAVLNVKHTGCDIFIATAAVADFACGVVASQKIKKQNTSEWNLSLKPNPDILKIISMGADRPFCVGFAAETEQALVYAEKKLIEKRLDMIAVNSVNEPGVGFETATNALTVLWQDRQVKLPLASKFDIAKQLLTLVSECYREKNSA